MRNSNGYEYLVAFDSLKRKRFVQRKIKFGGRSEWNIEYRGVVVRYLALRYFFGRVVELVDTRDLKSLAIKACGFDSRFDYKTSIVGLF